MTQGGVLCFSNLFQAALAGSVAERSNWVVTHLLPGSSGQQESILLRFITEPIISYKINKNMGLWIKRPGNGDGREYQLYLLIHSRYSWLRYYS